MANSFIKKLIQKIIDIVAPPGAIMMYGGSQVPEGWMLIQNVKVYEDELPRLYPVLAACPELEKGEDDGRKWVKMVNPEGRVPQFTTSGSLVWKLLEAQLPNISGYFSPCATAGFAIGAITTGPFSVGEQFSNRIISGDVANPSDGHYMNFIASDSSSFYSGDNVQMSSLQALPCIKI